MRHLELMALESFGQTWNHSKFHPSLLLVFGCSSSVGRRWWCNCSRNLRTNVSHSVDLLMDFLTDFITLIWQKRVIFVFCCITQPNLRMAGGAHNRRTYGHHGHHNRRRYRRPSTTVARSYSFLRGERLYKWINENGTKFKEAMEESFLHTFSHHPEQVLEGKRLKNCSDARLMRLQKAWLDVLLWRNSFSSSVSWLSSHFFRSLRNEWYLYENYSAKWSNVINYLSHD